MQSSVRSFWLPLWAALLWLTPPVSAVDIDWVNVGNPGNACEDFPPPGGDCFGAVASAYRISKYEVTNDQYAEFLNAVADTDTNGLYNANMNSGLLSGIVQLGLTGSFSYIVPGGGTLPVNYVSFYDALRFANWLHNGQPMPPAGPVQQTSATTEDGAYRFSGATTVGARNANATIFLPSEDEWYKAAYHDVLSTCVGDYCDYPARLDAQTTCAAPGATANTANCNNVVGNLTNVGFYTGSSSPYGTFDQGGNVWEWNEASFAGGFRGQRGGSFGFTPGNLASSVQRLGTPTDEVDFVGFRPAMIPEPNTALLLMIGMLTLAVRRRRA